MADFSTNRLESPDGNGEPRRPLLSVALLPSAATLGNLLCGVLAIMCSLLAIRAAYFDAGPKTANPHLLAWFPTYIAVGAYLIVLAMVFDALDGRLARIARHTTEFGAQLDSIADVVSFGTAPAMLLLALLLPLAVPAEGEPIVGKLEWRLGLLGALVYVSCAAIRLARYNAENIEEEAAQPRFRGLPAPGGGGGGGARGGGGAPPRRRAPPPASSPCWCCTKTWCSSRSRCSAMTGPVPCATRWAWWRSCLGS